MITYKILCGWGQEDDGRADTKVIAEVLYPDSARTAGFIVTTRKSLALERFGVIEGIRNEANS